MASPAPPSPTLIAEPTYEISLDDESPAPAGTETSKSGTASKLPQNPWVYFWAGFVLSFLFSFFAFIPLCFVDELRENKRNRKYYIWAVLLPVLFHVGLIILAIILYILIAVGIIVIGTSASSS